MHVTVHAPVGKVTAASGAVPAASCVANVVMEATATPLMFAAVAVTAARIVCVPVAKPVVTAPPVKVT